MFGVHSALSDAVLPPTQKERFPLLLPVCVTAVSVVHPTEEDA